MAAAGSIFSFSYLIWFHSVFKRKYWSEPKRHTEKDALKKAHTTQTKTQKKTLSSQRAAAASKLGASTYPGHSAGLQGWVPLPLHTVRCRHVQSFFVRRLNRLLLSLRESSKPYSPLLQGMFKRRYWSEPKRHIRKRHGKRRT